MNNLILYGAGNRCGVLTQLMDLCNMPIAHIVDSNSKTWGLTIGKHIVESPDILLKSGQKLVCITTAGFLPLADIRNKLINDYNIGVENQISYHSLIMRVYEKEEVLKHFTAKKINYSHQLSIIFDCEFGLVLGGVEEWAKGICREFIRKKEYASYILANYSDYNVPEDLQEHILRVNVEKENTFSINSLKEIVECIEKYLPCILVTSQPDEVLLAGKLLKKLYGDQLIVVSGIRGGYEDINKRYIAMKSCTDIYVCVNSAIRRDMLTRGISEDKIFTMLCPVECPDTLKRAYTVNLNMPIRLGYAGRFEVDEKRMDLLLHMISEMEQQHVNYYFELAGEGIYKDEILKFIKQNVLQDKVKLLGKLDKGLIPGFWSDKDICINISDHEGRSRSTVEAMANGAIPVVTKTWGVDDDIIDGKNGYTINVGDYKAMAQRIAMLDKNREQLPEMGALAHQEIKSKSSMDEHYQFWQKIINIAIKKHIE